jgi:hypothetical protein
MVFTDRTHLNSRNSSWILEYVPGAENYYRIRNKSNGEYLYAGPDDMTKDSLRRRVFTWINTNTALDAWGFERDWKIIPGKNGFNIQNRLITNFVNRWEVRDMAIITGASFTMLT